MNVVHIKKKGTGKTRAVFVPDEAEKAALRTLLPELTRRMVEADRRGVAHGFFPGRNCVTNALRHVGKKYTLKFDLADFFDTVRRAMVPDALKTGDFSKCWVMVKREPELLSEIAPGTTVWYTKTNGKPEMGVVKQKHPTQNAYWVVYHCNMDWEHYYDYTAALTDAVYLRLTKRNEESEQIQKFHGQGLPTSPLLANIAAAPMDEALLALSRREGRFDNRFIYTRYADDLTFSFDDPRMASYLKAEVPKVVESFGFRLNVRKTRLQSAAFGRRMVTGVAVGDKGIHPRREARRKLRAALHQGRQAQASGLAEYVKLKLPKNYKTGGMFDTVTHAMAEAMHTFVSWFARPMPETDGPRPAGRRFRL